MRHRGKPNLFQGPRQIKKDAELQRKKLYKRYVLGRKTTQHEVFFYEIQQRAVFQLAFSLVLLMKCCTAAERKSAICWISNGNRNITQVLWTTWFSFTRRVRWGDAYPARPWRFPDASTRTLPGQLTRLQTRRPSTGVGQQQSKPRGAQTPGIQVY